MMAGEGLGARPYGGALFLALLMFFFIGTSPFLDRSGANLIDPQADSSNLLNQLAAVTLTASLAAYGLHRAVVRDAMFQPRALLIPLFLWFAWASILSPDPALALRRVVLAAMTCLNASVFLLLPRSGRHFAKLMVIGTGIMLAVAYLGVIAIPGRAIHQATELLEAEHAGLWHGQFPHKNVAAGVMVLAFFVALFTYRAGFRAVSLGLMAASAFFLLQTGGKSALGYLPATLGVAWLFERWRWARLPIVLGGPVLFNALAVGCALSEGVSAFVASLGIDPTFTARTDIWRLALDAIARHPVFGYGFQGFWQTDELFYSRSASGTWAVQAYNGHNAWIDLALTTGLPSMVLAAVWLLVLPLRDYNRAETTGNDPALTRLFLRIWLYGLFQACLESVFFQSGEPLWFLFLASVFGLRLQAGARAVSDAAPARRFGPARLGTAFSG